MVFYSLKKKIIQSCPKKECIFFHKAKKQDVT